MHGSHQKNLSELRARFEAIPANAVSVACFEFEFQKFDFDWQKFKYPQVEQQWSMCRFHDVSASRYGEPSDFGRSWVYWWEDRSAMQTYAKVAAEAAYHLAGCKGCQWAANYGISEHTLQGKPNYSTWTHAMFDLLKQKKHPAFDLPVKFDWVSDLAISTGRPLEILLSCMTEHRNVTAEEKAELDGYGIHAKIDDLAFVSVKAIDRLANYDAEGEPWPDPTIPPTREDIAKRYFGPLTDKHGSGRGSKNLKFAELEPMFDEVGVEYTLDTLNSIIRQFPDKSRKISK